MNCELRIDSLSEEERFNILPSYLRDYNMGDYNNENLVDKIKRLEYEIKRLEYELVEMKEKLSKIERVMPWVSETFDMDEKKDM